MLTINENLQEDRYRIIHQSGQDGAEIAYEAFDNVLKTKVVLKEISVNLKKVFPADHQKTHNLVFADRAKLLTEIKHESLLHVRDYFSEIDRQYLVLEYIDGTDLGALLEKNKRPFTFAEVANWADRLLDALGYLHALNPPLIHRDIQPQNIKLTSAGQIKLLAFDHAGNSDAKENPALKQRTFNPAALHFLPLEQIWEGLDAASKNVILNNYDEKSERILEQPADARSDIYALGATLYYLITARLPVDALERSIDTLEGKPDPLPTPQQLNPSVPPEISDALMKALEIRREKRFDSAVIMRQVLRTAFVRIKECAAQTAATDEVVLEIPFAEQKSSAPATSLPKQINAENAESEAELIKCQLRESEAQRLKAEQRAAEAEKRLLETKAKNSNTSQSLTETENIWEDLSQATLPSNNPPDNDKQIISQEFSPENDLFNTPQKMKSAAWRMPVIALILLICGGAGFGIWWMTSKSAEPNQTVSDQKVSSQSVSNQSVSSSESAAPPIENAPSKDAAAPMLETNLSSTEALSSDSSKKSPNQSQIKNKPAPPRLEKQISPTKAPIKQKKIVTVDDIINDN